MPRTTTIVPRYRIWLIPQADLFDPAEFLAAVLPAKPAEPAPFPFEIEDLPRAQAPVRDPQPLTREIELRTRNARNLLRWIARRDAHKQPFGYTVQP